MKIRTILLRLAAVPLAAALLCGCAGDKKPTEPTDVPNDVPVKGTEIHVLSLGKADCILILADGEAMLIDTGYREQGDRIVGYLKELGVKQLKYVVLTHGDKDHIGGMEKVLRSFSVGQVFLSPKKESSSEYRAMAAALTDTGTPYSFPELLTQFTLGKGVFTVLGPGEKALKDGSDNDASLVLRYTYGNRSALFMGDALKKTEKEMQDNGYELQAEILKIGHHGREDATQKKFIKSVAPEYAVICCGNSIGDDEKGEPDADVLRVLPSFSVNVYRTDEKGTVVFASDGDMNWEVRTEQ